MSLRSLVSCSLMALMLATLVSCSGSSDTKSAKKSKAKSNTKQTDSADGAVGKSESESSGDTSYQPITLNSGSSTATEGSSVDLNAPPKREDVVKGLQPIQKVLVGNWKGLVKNAAAQEDHQWIWDYKTDKVFPALLLKTPNGQFFTEARLTFDPRINKYLMQTRDKEQIVHKFEGEFTAEPQDIPSDDGKSVERAYKLQLTEVDAEGLSTRWRFTLNQQNNNRYLVEVGRARGKSTFNNVDIIGTQREGTSFARADDDYGDKTCVVSEGLGTSTVSFKGRTFWVCCSGCKAAFDDDPEGWIAKFEAKKKTAK